MNNHEDSPRKIPLFQARWMLSSAGAVIIDDHAVCFCNPEELTGNPDNVFLEFAWEDDGLSYTAGFPEDQPEILYQDGRLEMTSSDDERVTLTLLDRRNDQEAGRVYLSKEEVEGLRKEPHELFSRTLEALVERGGWNHARVYNLLRSAFAMPPGPSPVEEVESELVPCSACPRLVWFEDSWSAGDEVLCCECNLEVTGRWAGPSIDPSKQGPPAPHSPNP